MDKIVIHDNLCPNWEKFEETHKKNDYLDKDSKIDAFKLIGDLYSECVVENKYQTGLSCFKEVVKKCVAEKHGQLIN